MLEYDVGHSIGSWCFVWAEVVDCLRQLLLGDVCPFLCWFRVKVVSWDCRYDRRGREQSLGEDLAFFFVRCCLDNLPIWACFAQGGYARFAPVTAWV